MTTELLMPSLLIMAQGMFGIFVFMMIFYSIIEVLNRMDRKKQA